MTLDKIKRGQSIKIIAIPDEKIRTQAIRFGIAEGEVVTCSSIIPAGPVIVSKGKQEIAIGRRLSQRIQVELIQERIYQDLRGGERNAPLRS